MGVNGTLGGGPSTVNVFELRFEGVCARDGSPEPAMEPYDGLLKLGDERRAAGFRRAMAVLMSGDYVTGTRSEGKLRRLPSVSSTGSSEAKTRPCGRKKWWERTDSSRRGRRTRGGGRK